ncbi:hypothetical protein MENTO_v1c03670 [Mesoplasma entomophilum]|uniref:Uncharacterized protein n=1 Tax=Mesoplasma entomophilum TaxID=2149 RepID=A0A3S5XZ43_9MOLU|nr:hypothetical protein [Mesoplasma entomophilum]ATQ35513.1 hypothetical protein CS528_01890 [Mesoplasma entomophilum]ATZ19473.1 hypothetical protein MENTO_v1c03670 [Mesoplasma entomophilum]
MRNISIDLINKINNYILKQKFSADATLAILNKELLNYDKATQEHIKKYTLYLIWLDDNKKDASQAWEKYVARVEVLEAKNNVKLVNEKQTEKLIKDLQDPFSKINQNKQKRSRLNSLSNNLWKKQEEEKPKQIAFEEVISKEGEILITNIYAETVDNDLTNETIEDITEENTIPTYDEEQSQDASELIESINKTISENFDKSEELDFDEDLIDLTSTFEELKTSGTINTHEKTISEIISSTLQADKKEIFYEEYSDDQTDPVSENIDNDDLIFENYDQLPEDEKTIALFDDEINDYSTIDILGEIEYVEDEELIILENSLERQHDDTFLNTAELNEQSDDSIQTADYNELDGEALSFEEPNKEIRFNSEEDKVHFLHEKDYIKEGFNKPFKSTDIMQEKNEINFDFDQDAIKTEDYKELKQDTLTIFDETEERQHDDTFLNTAELNEQSDDSIQTADYNELDGEALSFEEPNKEIRFNSEEDKVHFLHEKDYIKEGFNKPFKSTDIMQEKNEINFDFDQDAIKTEDYEELEKMTTASLLETDEDSLKDFEFNTFEEKEISIISETQFNDNGYNNIEEISNETEVKDGSANHLIDNKVQYGEIDENFDHEIEKELNQIEETISNLESYTEKVNNEIDDLFFSEEERTLFEFESEELDVDDTMFENVTLSSGIDQEASTMDALKFLDDVEDKYENILSVDLEEEMLNDAREDSTMDALKFLDEVEDKYESLLSNNLDEEMLNDAREDSTMDALKFLDEVEDKYSKLFESMDEDEIGTIDNLNWQSDEEVDQIDSINLDHIAKVGEIIKYNNSDYIVVGMSQKTDNFGEIVETILVSENGDIDNSIELIVEIK